MCRLFLIIFFISIDFIASAQQRIIADSSAVSVRTFSRDRIITYKTDKAFQYENALEPPKSLWQRFWDWFWGKVDEVLSTENGRTAFKTILIVLAIAILVFFMLTITGMNKAGLFVKKDTDGIDYRVTDEDIHNIRFDEAIQRAVNEKNFRLAVRLLYLQTLKILTDKGLINWQINKTNVAYVQELNGSVHQQQFGNLTLQFENNWYGDVPIDESEFMTVEEQFNRFKRQLT